MKKFIINVIDGLSYLFMGGNEKEHDAIPFKQKVKTLIIWGSVIICCYVMLTLASD